MEAILAAAEAIAAEDIGDLTTSIIAERAGISVGSLYQYFEDREDIVDRLLERYRVRLDEMTDKVFADGTLTTPAAGVAAVLDRYVDAVRNDTAFRVLWFSTEFTNPHRVVLDASDHALTRSFLDAAYQHGLLASPRADRLIELLAAWTAIDAVIDAAFRMDAAGHQGMIDEAGKLAAAVGARPAA